MGKEGIKMTQADKAEIGRISQAAVIGAGVMGSGIAAHLANAGVPVLLLDIVPPDADNRNVLAGTALKKLNKADPAAFMHKKNARLVTPGNLEDDLEKVAEADWIVEAVVERLDIKQDVYGREGQGWLLPAQPGRRREGQRGGGPGNRRVLSGASGHSRGRQDGQVVWTTWIGPASGRQWEVCLERALPDS